MLGPINSDHCDFCRPSFEHGIYNERSCGHCSKHYRICANHAAYWADRCVSCQTKLCPQCVGFDRHSQDTVAPCRKCKSSQAPPIPEEKFEVIQMELEEQRGYSAPPRIFVTNDDEEIVVGLNSPFTSNFFQTHTRKQIRIMSWNIRDLGGGPGGPAVRLDVVITMTAAVIHFGDPHICAIMEVKGGPNRAVKSQPKGKKKIISTWGGKKRRRKKSTQSVDPGGKGFAEVERILAALNMIGSTSSPVRQWKVAYHVNSEVFQDGETYAFIYRDCPDIAIDQDSVVYVTHDRSGNELDFPNKTNRRPMQAIFRLSGELSSKGQAWDLPVVVFHAPSPSHDMDTVRAVRAFTNIGIYHQGVLLSPCDVILAADLNIDSNCDVNVKSPKRKYAEQGLRYLQPFVKWVGQDVALNTTLKKVTTDYEPPERYEFEIEVDHLRWLFEDGLSDTKAESRRQKFVERFGLEYGSDEANDFLQECEDELHEAEHELAPSSGFDFTCASYDKLFLLSALTTVPGTSTETLDPRCVLSNPQVDVFPVLELVTPPSALARFFPHRTPTGFDGVLYELARELFAARLGDHFQESDISLTDALAIAGMLSDHLPLLLHCEYT